MVETEVKNKPERKKRTLWLLVGGAISLLLPLMVLAGLYLMWTQNNETQSPSGRTDVFEHRDDGEKKVRPNLSAVPVSSLAMPKNDAMPKPKTKNGSSSLDFVKSNEELNEKMAETPAPAPKPTPEPTKPVKKETATKPAKKIFTQPKLQPTRGFSKMQGKKEAKSSEAADSQDMQEMLKNLPPEARNNPQLQQYLKGK